MENLNVIKQRPDIKKRLEEIKEMYEARRNEEPEWDSKEIVRQEIERLKKYWAEHPREIKEYQYKVIKYGDIEIRY